MSTFSDQEEISFLRRELEDERRLAATRLKALELYPMILEAVVDRLASTEQLLDDLEPSLDQVDPFHLGVKHVTRRVRWALAGQSALRRNPG